MATIKIEIVAGAQTYTSTKTVSAAHLVRMLAALRTHYAMPAATDAQVAAEWIDRTYAATRGLVKQVETQAAIQSAADAVTEIGMT